MSEIAVNAITDASGGSTASINGYTPTVSNMAGRNRIINGDMRIDQRNAGAAVTTTNAFPVDRFKVAVGTDGAFSAQQDSSAPDGFVSSLKFTTTTADASLGATQYTSILQNIEGLNVADLGWGTANAKTVTLSFWVRSSLTGTFGGSVRNSALDRSYPFNYTISVADTWEYKTVTIPGDTSGTWLTTTGVGIGIIFGLGVGSTFSGTAGAWAGANYLTATGATSVVGTSGATFYLTGVQLEAGSTATPFEHRQYGQELALCQRYYVKMIDPGLRGVVGGTSGVTRVGCSLPVQMRSAPTFSVTQVGGTGQARFFDGTVSTGVISSLDAQYSTNQRIECDFSLNTTGYTTGRAACLYIDTANNYSSAFHITAEL